MVPLPFSDRVRGGILGEIPPFYLKWGRFRNIFSAKPIRRIMPSSLKLTTGTLVEIGRKKIDLFSVSATIYLVSSWI
jgi:hypothetical protein